MDFVNNYDRLLNLSDATDQSVFLFGPRGTGKTSWIKAHFTEALYIDLLETQNYQEFLSDPSRLENRIPAGFKNWIIIDEVQKVPALLNEVHRLIEAKRYRFILTGSSARQLKQEGVNLLGGRALNFKMHPLTCYELGNDFSLETALSFGLLPMVYRVSNPKLYLQSYVVNYLREEVLQEGIIRNIGEFARFLEIASFSQGETINHSEIARDAAIERRVVAGYFNIIEGLLIGFKLPVFTKRSKRRLIMHEKFYFFDAGVYRALRPTGPLDSPSRIDGPALETLFLEHLRAINDYYQLGYTFYFWRTSNGTEVDFIAYGEKGLLAFEIKRKRKVNPKDLTGLKAFGRDYEMAELYLIYGGEHQEYYDNITAIPFAKALFQLKELLKVV